MLEGQRRRLQSIASSRLRDVSERIRDSGERRLKGGPLSMKIAFIVQRYGAEILGGSEYHCRLIAERLAPKHDVEVLTTCARDYITWENEYPEGTRSHPGRDGPPLRERADARPRGLQPVLRLDLPLRAHARRRDGVAAAAGSLVPGAASSTSSATTSQFDVLIFFTYLYAPTVLGLRIDPRASILVPTAHDEPAIQLGIYKEMFSRAGRVAYNTEVERRFLTTTFDSRA